MTSSSLRAWEEECWQRVYELLGRSTPLRDTAQVSLLTAGRALPHRLLALSVALAARALHVACRQRLPLLAYAKVGIYRAGRALTKAGTLTRRTLTSGVSRIGSQPHPTRSSVGGIVRTSLSSPSVWRGAARVLEVIGLSATTQLPALALLGAGAAVAARQRALKQPTGEPAAACTSCQCLSCPEDHGAYSLWYLRVVAVLIMFMAMALLWYSDCAQKIWSCGQRIRFQRKESSPAMRRAAATRQLLGTATSVGAKLGTEGVDGETVLATMRELYHQLQKMQAKIEQHHAQLQHHALLLGITSPSTPARDDSRGDSPPRLLYSPSGFAIGAYDEESFRER